MVDRYGVIKIATVVWLRKLIETEWVLILSGVVSIFFGSLLIMFSVTVTLALVWLIGSYAVIFRIRTLMRTFLAHSRCDTPARQAAPTL
jgi:uncharacterized membrane protein HdeD (DUF308 family)